MLTPYDFTGEDYGRVVTFTVARMFKGPMHSEVVVKTGFGGGDCGIAFEVGRSYLVYTYANEELETGICTRTSKLENAKLDLAILTSSPR